MEAAASEEEEHGKEVEIVPATPDPMQQQQEGRDAMAHPDPGNQHYPASEVAATKIEEVLSKLQRLRAAISLLLGPTGVTAGDVRRCCLAFMETELSIIVAFPILIPQKFLEDTLLHVPGLVYSILREVDPSHQTLLGRAARCLVHRRKSYLLLRQMLRLYNIDKHPSWYRHLPTSSDLVTTPQLAKLEEGVLPLVGIDRLAKKIIRWLSHQGTKDRSHLRVLSIVGPMGIGKTTLAVELCNRLRQYETSEGRYYFKCNVMAPASRGSDRNILLLQDILSQVSEATAFSSDPSQAKTMEVLVPLVSECLRNKRYFVIIDNIWEASDWEKIKDAFPNNDLDSRILITTRSTSTAWACCSDSYDSLVHEMKPLSEVDSKRLLLAKAVGSADACLPNNMKLICDEILRKCDGIPLFIIGMADWLKEQRLQKLHQQKEDEDREYQVFAMHYEEQVPRIQAWLEQAISSAFNNDVPTDDIRLLLFYMSMFPYGYKFEKDRLILKWLHEGLTHHDFDIYLFRNDAKSEAETFFSQLVDRNVITCVASNCKHKQDETNACQWQVNHFLQQFLASKSAEMGFFFTITTLNLVAPAATGRVNETGNRMPRRLALHHPVPQLQSLLETIDLSQTRSLAVSGAVSSIPLEKFVNLVVLDLEGWENLKDEDLLQVCKMIFLAYLSIRKTKAHKLPREIKELRILRTLDVSYTQINELPLELFELTDLWHLDLRGTRISQLPKQIAVLRDRLQVLLVGGEGTINSMEIAMPHDVLRLEYLQTLTVHLTQQPASFARALGNLEYLRVLTVTWSFHLSTDRDYCEEFLSSMGRWKHLKSLTINCGLGCSMESLEYIAPYQDYDGLRNLEMFKVTAGRFTCVPMWISYFFSQLSFVQITICNNQVTYHLQRLGELFRLQCLILALDFIPEHAIVIENRGFPELQRFSLECPMPWLTFKTGAMPKLTYLQLKFCSTPASHICVPSRISNLRRLTEVALCYNAQYINSPSIKMTVDAVTQQVAEHSNPIDLFINGIEQDDVQEYDDEIKEITIGTSSRTDAGAEDDAQAVSAENTAVVQCEITEAESRSSWAKLSSTTHGIISRLISGGSSTAEGR